MKRILFAGITLLAAVQTSYAASDLDQIDELAQDQFKSLSKDLGSALSYKAIAPAEPLGILGFDVGVEVTVTELSSADKWAAAVGGDAIDYLPVPKVHAHKGLPFGFDVGLMYTSVPTTNIKLLGGEVRYAIISGNVAIPAVAVRGTFTKLSGVDQLDFTTKGLELSVSKGLTLLTPYAGIGYIWSDSTPHVGSTVNLEKESISQAKLYVGANLNLGLLNFAGEVDQTGDNKSYSVKVGWRF
jgi:hypothetical protein